MGAMSARRTALVSLAFALSLVAVNARAADPIPVDDAPIVDDLDRARPLAPAPGLVQALPPAEPDIEYPSKTVVFGHARWITVPDAVLGLFFDSHPSLSNVSAGLAVEIGAPQDQVWAIELDWSAYGPESGNWLATGTSPIGTTYADGALHLVSIDVNYRRQTEFTAGFRGFIGAGLGVGVLLGDFRLFEVLPTCQEPVSKCAHWPRATERNAELPTRVVPIVHLTAGLEYDFGGVIMRLQGGFRDAVYLGLSIGAEL